MPYEVAPLQGRTILVSDVDESILALLTDVFRNDGAEVVSALGGQAAINAMLSGRFDLIVQALVLPDVDGWDVLHFARTRRPDLVERMIFMTGCLHDGETAGRLQSLTRPVLFKPFDLDHLRTVARNTLETAETKPIRTAA